MFNENVYYDDDLNDGIETIKVSNLQMLNLDIVNCTVKRVLEQRNGERVETDSEITSILCYRYLRNDNDDFTTIENIKDLTDEEYDAVLKEVSEYSQYC